MARMCENGGATLAYLCRTPLYQDTGKKFEIHLLHFKARSKQLQCGTDLNPKEKKKKRKTKKGTTKDYGERNGSNKLAFLR